MWVLPGDPNFPGLFPDGQTLITRDGQPWDSTIVPIGNPLILNIDFEPIDPGHILDVHKALLWVGNGTNTIWGDEPSETFIEVREYPTPEPGSLALAALGAALLALWRKQHHPTRAL
jgi:MYXO-CTERM domain-containing protein